MDYHALAQELMYSMYLMNKSKPHRELGDRMRGEAFVLQYAFQHEGPVLPSEISQAMNISSARMAATLNTLERKGLVTRQIDPADRRRIIVHLTEEGLAAAKRGQQAMSEHMVQMLETLGEDDAREFVRLSGKVARIVVEMHSALHEHCHGETGHEHRRKPPVRSQANAK